MILFSSEKDCCSCGACVSSCPQKAIKMVDTKYGYQIPQVDDNLCNDCGVCIKVCPFKQIHNLTKCRTVSVYAGATRNSDIKKSTSGGIFASFATSVIRDGGICYGASMELIDSIVKVRHIAVDNLIDLQKILGSKYVQSNTTEVYRDIKKLLESENFVLFSGTPCQVAALRSFLRKDYNNLLCIDIICHGVPGVGLFQSYIEHLEKKGKKIISFLFRDKRYGWNSIGSMTYCNRNQKRHTAPVFVSESSYYMLFEHSYTLRSSCYSCPFSTPERVGDITIGDYWGIQKEHPEYLSCNGGELNEADGISCVLINTEKGASFLDKYGDGLMLYPSELGKVSRNNPRLLHPSNMPAERDEIFNLYKEKGYDKVEKWYWRKFRNKIIIRMLINRIPIKIKNYFK